MKKLISKQLNILALIFVLLISTYVNASSTDLIVWAKGSKAHGVFAHFKVIVNNLECGDKYTSSIYEGYCFSIPFSQHEIKKIKIVFDNDHYSFGEDRNLYIESIIIGNDLNIKADSNLVKYVCINGKKIDYPGVMGWEGELIFDITKLKSIPSIYSSVFSKD